MVILTISSFLDTIENNCPTAPQFESWNSLKCTMVDHVNLKKFVYSTKKTLKYYSGRKNFICNSTI